MAFYPDILDIFNRDAFVDDGQLADAMESDRPLGMSDMQEWADSLAIAGGVLGAAYEDAGMLQGHYMREPEPAEQQPVAPAFDPDDCIVLNKPMSLRRGRITIKARF